MRRYYIGLGVLGFITILLVVLQYVFPHRQRLDLRVDEKIVSDFSALETEIDSYAREHGELPDDLSALSPSTNLKKRIDTLGYEYKPDDSSYKLCATFRTDASAMDEEEEQPWDLFLNSDIYSDTSDLPKEDNPEYHRKGHVCYDYEAAVNYYDDYYFEDDFYDDSLREQELFRDSTIDI